MATEDDDFSLASRTSDEIGEALEKLTHQVWYNRCHVPMFENINLGIEKCDPEIWKRALKHAEKLRAEYTPDELGPFSEIEYGMILGKLSALRWVCGEDWDSLDT